MTGVGVSGRQPVRIPKKNKVLKTDIMSEFRMEGHGRREWSAKRLADGRNRIQDNTGIAAQWDNGVVGTKHTRKHGAEAEDIV